MMFTFFSFDGVISIVLVCFRLRFFRFWAFFSVGCLIVCLIARSFAINTHLLEERLKVYFLTLKCDTKTFLLLFFFLEKWTGKIVNNQTRRCSKTNNQTSHSCTTRLNVFVN